MFLKRNKQMNQHTKTKLNGIQDVLESLRGTQISEGTTAPTWLLASCSPPRVHPKNKISSRGSKLRFSQVTGKHIHEWGRSVSLEKCRYLAPSFRFPFFIRMWRIRIPFNCKQREMENNNGLCKMGITSLLWRNSQSSTGMAAVFQKVDKAICNPQLCHL